MSDVLNSQSNTPRVADAREALNALDEMIHQKARLGIMSTLLALGEADFKLLKETLALSDGNLSTHLALLEERGYVAVRKEFVRRKPHTTYSPTEEGRAAFQRYLAALERIVQATVPAREVVHTPNPTESGRGTATLKPKNA
jgi:DNA-binding HxlR family transcriptional regulator